MHKSLLSESRPVSEAPTTPSSLVTGIPSFRALRSLLPFSPNKQPSTSLSNGIRSPFSHLGTIRRSTSAKGEKGTGQESTTPIIAIGPSLPNATDFDERIIRRSISCSGLMPNGNEILYTATNPPFLRTPSPGPPISADLSIILEAETSFFSNQGQEADPIPSQDVLAGGPEKPLLAACSSQQKSKEELSYAASQTFSRPPLSSPTARSFLPRYTYNSLPPSPSSLTHSSINQAPAVTLTLPVTSSTSTANSSVRQTVSTSPTRIPNIFPSAGPSRDISSSSSTRLSRPPESPVHPTTLPPRLSSPFKHDFDVRASPSSSSPLQNAPPVVVTDPPSPIHSSSSNLNFNIGSRASTPRGSKGEASPSGSNATITALRNPANWWKLQHKRSMSACELSPPPPPPPPIKASTAPALTLPEKQAQHDDPDSDHQASPSVPIAEFLSADLGGAKDDFTTPSPPYGLPQTFVSHRQEQEEPARSRKRSMSVQEQSSPSYLRSKALRGRLGGGLSRGGGLLSRGRAPLRTGVRRRGDIRGGASPFRDEDRDRQEGGDQDVSPVQDQAGWEDGAGHYDELRTSSSLSGRFHPRVRVQSEVDRAGYGTAHRPYRLRTPDWLGPRTAKALKAAGLLDFERDDEGFERDAHSNSGSLGRLAFARSVSEYNPRVPSRLAFSEAGGSSSVAGETRSSYLGDGWKGGAKHSRKGSEYGAIGSPPHTAGSSTSTATTMTRERSSSTAPTTLSAGSSFFSASRDRDYRDRELGIDGSKPSMGCGESVDVKELKDLKDKHATETGALLHALSDSQRTVKVLREENDELRGRISRLEDVEGENGALKREVNDLRRELGGLRARAVGRVSAPSGSGSGTKRIRGDWTTKRSALATAIPVGHDDIGDTDIEDEAEPSWGRERSKHRPQEVQDRHPRHLRRDFDDVEEPTMRLPLPASSTPTSNSKQGRRPRMNATSTSMSSVFGPVPDDMDLLLHANHEHNNVNYDEGHTPLSVPLSDPVPQPIPKANVSPTMTNFSVLSGTQTGSPGSLFLKPEHELHLGDMESLDLGSMRLEEVENESDGW